MADDTMTRQLEYRIGQLETKIREMGVAGAVSPIERLAAFSEGSCTNNCTAACTIGCTKGCTGSCIAQPVGEVVVPQATIAAVRVSAPAAAVSDVEMFNKLAGR